MKKATDLIQLELQNSLMLLNAWKSPSLILAVSGGKDSVSMLHAFVQLQTSKNLKISVAHYNHGLRPESEAEAEFLKNLCTAMDVACVIGKAPAFSKKENMEAWARTHRYEFLEKTRQKLDADFVLTAHHKNDLAETVLMRILSGRAAVNFGGVKKIDFVQRLFRPMLGINRELVENYILENNLAFVEDSSNSNLEITRNRIRAEIIPTLEHKINPGLIDSLCVLADRINTDEESIWDLVNRIYLEAENTNIWEFYSKQPRYIRWRLLKLELEKQLGRRKVGYYSLARLSEALDTQDGSPKTIELGWGVICKFSRKGVLEFSSAVDSEASG